jgi:hypothetical protein
VIERIAYNLGIVPRALRNAGWIVVISCVVAALCVWVDTSNYSALILVLLVAFPFRMRPSTRAWTSHAGTEWMLASGAWTRAMLARSTVFEIVVLAASGASALAVIAMAHAIVVPEGVVRSFVFFASAVVSFQGLTAVLANWNSSSRVPARAHLPRIRNPEIASPLRIVFLVVWVASVSSLAAVKGRPMWVVPTGALVLIATYWLVSGAEANRTGDGAEIVDQRRVPLFARRVSMWRGLLWEGSRPLARMFVVLVLVLPLARPLGRALDWQPNVGTLHVLNMVMLSWVAGSPFRWESKGGRCEFLCTAGVILRKARRMELVAGLVVGLEMLAVGYLIDLPGSILPTPWLMYAVVFCAILLVCNQARISLVFGPAMRVARLLPWGALVGVCLAVAFVFISIAIEHEPSWLPSAFVGAFLAMAISAPPGLWIWAFLRAGNDERLRQDEFEPKLYLVKRR